MYPFLPAIPYCTRDFEAADLRVADVNEYHIKGH
jgi:hypothetical protein